MKIALYMEDVLEQIVLTAEGDFETSMLAKLADGTRALSIKTGSFYPCQGGFVRHSDHARKDSTIIVLSKKAPQQ